MRNNFSDKYESESTASQQSFSVFTKYIAVVSTIFLVLIGTVYYTGNKSTETIVSSSLKTSTLTSSSTTTFTFRRVGYEPLKYFDSNVKSQLKYSFLSKYIAVIEPFADMELKLFDTNDETKLTRSFSFKICPSSSDSSSSCQSGTRLYDSSSQTVTTTSFSMNCKAFDKFDVDVTEIDPDSNVVLSHTTAKAICLYVRREIRGLTDSDLSSFLDSSHKLWVTSETEGEQLYGSKFRPVSFLLKYHHYNAAQRRTDSIHNGNGVVLQHIKFTNMFESSVQSVDPRQSLPYWDYTIDQNKGYKAFNDVTTELIFGSCGSPSDVSIGFQSNEDISLGSIRDGRWKGLVTPLLRDLVVGTVEGDNNPYGYLRAPWNLNPSPYVSRFPMDLTSDLTKTKDRLPTCQSHFTALKSEDLMQFFFDSEMEPHGGNHLVLGGVYGCDHFNKMIKSGHLSDQSSAMLVCLFWISAVVKSLYRQNLLSPPPSCSVEDAPEKCSYQCDRSRDSEIYTYIHHYITKHLNLQDMTSTGSLLTKQQDQDGWISFLCEEGGGGSQIYIGDQFESSSPKDPSFWVIHPTIERLLQAKFLSGGFTSEDWKSDPINEKVCDYARCLDLTTNSLVYSEDCCYGHFENDRMFDISGKGYFGPSNREVLQALDPRSEAYSIPYIYDNFSWKHCEEDFDELLSNLKQSHNN